MRLIVTIAVVHLAILYAAGPPRSPQAATLSVQELKCEYRTNPAVIDALAPRLGWILAANEHGQKQTAFQVLVASDQAGLAADRGDLWDSGKVESSETSQLPYAGKPLTSRLHCYWKVRVWDKYSRASDWSAPAMWSMGLLHPSDWIAQWIGADATSNDLPLVRKDFLVSKLVKRATVYVAAPGSFELHLNGEKIGDDVLEPSWTYFRTRSAYKTYDVSAQIRSGANTLGVMLGNGMYNVTGDRYVKFRSSLGAPTMILQIDLEFNDSTRAQVASGASWRVGSGPITFSSIYGGEDYDARREQSGWDAPGFDDSKWTRATVMDAPSARLVADTAPPVRIMREFEPVAVAEPKPGIYVYDLGQNFSGWPTLTVSGQAGATIKMVPGELLEKNGLVTQLSSGSPYFLTYTLKGKAEETWHPRFSYYGFRYLQVEGAVPETTGGHGPPIIRRIAGQFLHSSSETVGTFSCSNALINRIHRLINAAILSNLQSVLTDCPHREKLGWLEQGQLMAPSIMLNYDVAALYTKWLDDVSDSQLPNGLVPDTAPEYVVFRGYDRDSPEWGSFSVIVPWYLYQTYGDIAVLRRQYNSMRAYVGFLANRAVGDTITYGVGDWVLPERAPGMDPPKGLTGSAIYYGDLVILEKVAALLDERADSEKYRTLAARVRAAFNERFFDQSSGAYSSGTQTANAMPLVFGIAEPGRSAGLVDAIVSNVRALGNHTSAGEVGWRSVLQALSDNGRSDVIYDMLSRTDNPSYGYQLSQGATSLTEAWDTDKNESQNHCMIGQAEEWFYKVLAGISSDQDAVAFDRIVIKPHPVGEVTWCAATYRSARGRISSHWQIVDRDLHLDIDIPPNTTATVYIPAAAASSVTEEGHSVLGSEFIRYLRMESGVAVFAVVSGQYSFVSKDFR